MLGLIALAGLGACGGNDTPTSAGATIPKATTPTSAADPYAVPPTIDAAYLNRVFAALEHVDGDATRAVVASKAFVPDAAKRLRSIYAEDEFQEQVKLWLDIVIKKDFARSKSSPGDIKVVVQRVVTARPKCIYVAVERDYSNVVVNPGSTEVSYIGLRPLDRSRDPFKFNPTPWMMAYDGYHPDGSQPANPCDS